MDTQAYFQVSPDNAREGIGLATHRTTRGSRSLLACLLAAGLVALASPAAAAPSLAAGDVQVPEPDTGSLTAEVAVSLSSKASKAVTVEYRTVDGSAKAGVDYTAESGTLRFPAGVKTKKVSVEVLGDAMDERDERFSVKVLRPQRASIADANGKVTIVDNDAPPTLSIADSPLVEGDEGTMEGSFEVTLSAPSGKHITVEYSTDEGEAADPALSPEDFEAGAGVLVFPKGTTSRTITVPIVGENLDEENESFTVDLMDPKQATIADGSATGTILDDDPEAQIFIEQADSGSEPASGSTTSTSIALTVNLNKMSGRMVTVDWTQSPGTASPGADYVNDPATGTFTFEPGEQSKTFNVLVSPDALDEDNETVHLALSNPSSGAIAGDGTGVATIMDNDSPPSVSVGDASATDEGDALTYPVTLSTESGREVTVNYTTSPGANTESADADMTGGSVTFAAGDTTENITVATTEDSIDEISESVNVALGSPNLQKVTIGDGSATGSITDDDDPPKVSITNSPAANEGTQLGFTVSLEYPSEKPVTVLASTGGNPNAAQYEGATAGVDYTAITNQTVSFVSGDQQETVNVNTTNDPIDELAESLVLTLSSPTNATLGNASESVGTIQDTDSQPTLSLQPRAINEGEVGNVTATLSHPTSRPVRFDVDSSSIGASALALLDYDILGLTDVTIPAGQTSTTFSVWTLEDILDEANETFKITISSRSAHVDLGSNPVVFTITDDD